MVKYNLIVAMSKNNGIGHKGKLPWSIKEDMRYFSEITKGDGNNAVIMGHNTWKSLPSVNGKPRGLTSRDNFILSNSLTQESIDKEIGNTTKVFNSIQALDVFFNNSENDNYEDIWVIGGSQIYSQFLEANKINKCYVTYIDKEFECDTFFPRLVSDEWKEVDHIFTYDVANICDVNYIVHERIQNVSSY
jgi:dihydrofolate reductase